MNITCQVIITGGGGCYQIMEHIGIPRHLDGVCTCTIIPKGVVDVECNRMNGRGSLN